MYQSDETLYIFKFSFGRFEISLPDHLHVLQSLNFVPISFHSFKVEKYRNILADLFEEWNAIARLPAMRMWIWVYVGSLIFTISGPIQ